MKDVRFLWSYETQALLIVKVLNSWKLKIMLETYKNVLKIIKFLYSQNDVSMFKFVN